MSIGFRHLEVTTTLQRTALKAKNSEIVEWWCGGLGGCVTNGSELRSEYQ